MKFARKTARLIMFHQLLGARMARAFSPCRAASLAGLSWRTGGAPAMTDGQTPSRGVMAATPSDGGANKIFCNRELTLSQIEAVGFDMDYTLAQYTPEFDLLAYEGSLRKLVDMGYPAEVLGYKYDPSRFSRGLVMDKKRGNLLKMDRYKYVRVAAHGSRRLSRGERRSVYRASREDLTDSFTGKDYVNVDTQFQIVDAALFEQLVDLKDRSGSSDPFLASKAYEQLAVDVRRCVDLCHRDGVIKDKVAEDPGRYIVDDVELYPMLEQLRLAGKKVFLLTNSLYDYTDVVMSHLLHRHRVLTGCETEATMSDPTGGGGGGGGGGGESPLLGGAANDECGDLTPDWVDFFDVVVVGSCKPSYMLDPYLSMFRVVTSGGSGGFGNGGEAQYSLLNTDGVDKRVGSDAFLQKGNVFQGGNWLHLHDMVGVSNGDKVLYVGDHTYSDILRSKRTLGWRTCLVIPELERELDAYKEEPTRQAWRRLQRLRAKQSRVDIMVDALALQVYRADMATTKRSSSSLPAQPAVEQGEQGRPAQEGGGAKGGEGGGGNGVDREESWREQLSEDLADGLEQQRRIKEEVALHSEIYHARFHPRWGQIFKAGLMDSRFSKQVADYACLYTTKASDLGGVSPTRDFRPFSDLMPHDHSVMMTSGEYDIGYAYEYGEYDGDDEEADEGGLFT